MWNALIRCSGSLAIADVAGRTLLDRQIDWARSVGCERVVVETGDDDVRAWLRTRGIPHVRLGPRDTAESIARAGLGRSAAVLVVPAGVLAGCDVVRALATSGTGGAFIHASPPDGLDGPAEPLRVWMPGATVRTVCATGWAYQIRSVEDAQSLARSVWPEAVRTSVAPS